MGPDLATVGTVREGCEEGSMLVRRLPWRVWRQVVCTLVVVS